MGGCISSPAPPGAEVSDRDRQLHRQAEKALKDAKAKMAAQVKVLLLGSGDSGKSTILKQMRLIHRVPFSPQETESFRQLVFDNLTRGLKYLLDALPDMELELPPAYADVDDAGWVRGWAPGEGAAALAALAGKRGKKGAGSGDNGEDDEGVRGVRGEAIADDVTLIEHAEDLRDGEPFPMRFYGPLARLWAEPVVRTAWSRGNEAAVPENLHYFFSDLPRLFDPAYVPTEQDIVRARARTIGITETTFNLRDHEMLMVDVGGQKSERRKWIHCFQDVTSILFLVSLSGYDQCLVEDRDANQMQDAMTIWDSICHSQWFKQTSIILFLNKNDLFEKKIKTSDIKSFFPDFDGEPGSALAGRDYFKRRFGRLAQKAGRAKEREIYIHITTATDTELLRVIMAAVEAPSSAKIFVPSCFDNGTLPCGRGAGAW
ncbi:heterotrimeric G-protein alpha subunit, GPA2-like protein [Mycena albidolilacea]|uniref:Heterotrimeric G-protein alpha subunit, GPA2-like protein n=1 Tax=Mycena albidolilacea TaxID=1033008 RepID=A0AAD7AM82_9AGAR|nr:heterotrimeric G-protein alpha subunit, GPA2-like protein [Mycena albidolilacea]